MFGIKEIDVLALGKQIEAQPENFKLIDVRTPAEIDEFVKKWAGRHTLDEVGATVSLPVELLADSSYVGAVQLTPTEVDPTQVSIGWLTLPIHQGKGLMSEAVRAVVDVAFSEVCNKALGSKPRNLVNLTNQPPCQID